MEFAKIVGFMKDTGNFPLRNYFRSDISPELRKKYGVTEDNYIHQRPQVNWGNNIDCVRKMTYDWSISVAETAGRDGKRFHAGGCRHQLAESFSDVPLCGI